MLELSMDKATDVTGLDKEQIKVHMTFLGGGFGCSAWDDVV